MLPLQVGSSPSRRRVSLPDYTKRTRTITAYEEVPDKSSGSTYTPLARQTFFLTFGERSLCGDTKRVFHRTASES